MDREGLLLTLLCTHTVDLHLLLAALQPSFCKQKRKKHEADVPIGNTWMLHPFVALA